MIGDYPYDLDDSETAYCNRCKQPAYSCECDGYDDAEDLHDSSSDRYADREPFDRDNTFEREDPWPDGYGR